MPLKQTSEAAASDTSLAYAIDTNVILSFTERYSGNYTLNKLIRSENNVCQEFLEKSVFFSRFEAQLCFQISELIPAEDSLAKPISKLEPVKISPSKATFLMGDQENDA